MKDTAAIAQCHGAYPAANQSYWAPKRESSSRIRCALCLSSSEQRALHADRSLVLLLGERVLFLRLRHRDLELNADLRDRLTQRAQLSLIAAAACRDEQHGGDLIGNHTELALEHSDEWRCGSSKLRTELRRVLLGANGHRHALDDPVDALHMRVRLVERIHLRLTGAIQLRTTSHDRSPHSFHARVRLERSTGARMRRTVEHHHIRGKSKSPARQGSPYTVCIHRNSGLFEFTNS